MITLIINNENYYMPENWDEVSMRKGIELTKVSDENPLFRTAKIIQVLTGIKYDLIMDMPIAEFNKIDLSWVDNQEIKKKNAFIIDNVTYVINTDLNSMSVGEFADTQFFMTSIDTYDKLIAVLLRPKDEKYDSKKVEERSKLFNENLSAGDLFSITNFFLDGEQGLLVNLMTFLSKVKEQPIPTIMMDGEQQA